MAILELQKISKAFGGVHAVENLDIRVEKGEILGLIGPNGAGKTTTFNVISGVYPPSKGRILFEGQDITGMKAYKVVKMGIARTFQLTSLFMKYTVLENVLTGFHLSLRSGLWSSLFPTPESINKESTIRERALEILRFLEIGHLQDQMAQNLPFGHQRLLTLAMALALDPRLLMLDEPVGGLHSDEISMIIDRIEKIRDRKSDIAIVLVEHNMPVVMNICHRIAVMNFGVKIAEGSPEEIRSNPDVIQAYLGSTDAS